MKYCTDWYLHYVLIFLNYLGVHWSLTRMEFGVCFLLRFQKITYLKQKMPRSRKWLFPILVLCSTWWSRSAVVLVLFENLFFENYTIYC